MQRMIPDPSLCHLSRASPWDEIKLKISIFSTVCKKESADHTRFQSSTFRQEIDAIHKCLHPSESSLEEPGCLCLLPLHCNSHVCRCFIKPQESRCPLFKFSSAQAALFILAKLIPKFQVTLSDTPHSNDIS